MSHENVEVVRAFMRAVEVGDFETAFAYAHPDGEYRQPPETPGGRVYRGRQGFTEWAIHMAEAWEDMSFTTERFVHDGDTVAAVGTFRGRGRESGIEVEQRECFVWKVRDGRIAYGRLYYGVDEGLEAAGLRE